MGVPGPKGERGAQGSPGICGCINDPTHLDVQAERLRVINDNTNLSEADNVVVISANKPVTTVLPKLANVPLPAGQMVQTKKVTIRAKGNGFTHTIVPASGNTINEMSNHMLLNGNSTLTFYAYGNTWYSV